MNHGHLRNSPFHSYAAVSPTFVVVVALAVLIGTGAAIAHLHKLTNNCRLDEISLAELRSNAYQLAAIETDITAANIYDHAHRRELANVRTQLYAGVSHVLLSDSADEYSVRIQRAINLYNTASDSENQLVAAGRPITARVYASRVVEPDFILLMKEINLGMDSRRRTGDRSEKYTENGSISLSIFAGAIIVALMIGFGISQRRGQRLSTEREMIRLSEQRFSALVFNASDVIAIVSADGQVGYVSSAAKRLWGYEPEQLIGSSVYDLPVPEDGIRLRSALTAIASGSAESNFDDNLKLDITMRSAHGGTCASEIVVTDLLKDPAVGGIVMTCRDVTERREFENQLTHQAFHDSLTELPNRALFMERLQRALYRNSKTQNPVAVVFFDLDNFKVINDSLGHEVGDILLIGIAERLKACVKSTDTVARLGGDEFTVLLESLRDEEQILGVTERIISVLKTPFNLGGRDIVATGSLGISVSRGEYSRPDDLLRDADTALYQAKSNGKSRCVVFDQSMNLKAVERLELESELRIAIANNALSVYYQPIVDLNTNEICEVEALVRWNHPERGLLLPSKFIPLAEETGLVVPLGFQVLEETCYQAVKWHKQFPNEARISVGVNLASRQMLQPDLVEAVQDILHRTGLDPCYLKLEITESVMMSDTEGTIAKLTSLKHLGVRLAVDDFGTGYSSMSYLSSLPLDTLKVDRSFIMNLGKNEDDAIVRAIVTLAQTLGLKITCEGIETATQLSELKRLRCDRGQGFYFAEPLPVDKFDEVLSDFSQGGGKERPKLGRLFAPLNSKAA